MSFWFHWLAGSAPNINGSRDSRVHLRIDFFAITIGTNLTTLASSGLEISCPVTGFPKPSIQWYREGVPVEPGMMLNVEEDTGTLFTLSISHRKGGEFTCKASNPLGSDSASSFVTVLGENGFSEVYNDSCRRGVPLLVLRVQTPHLRKIFIWQPLLFMSDGLSACCLW